MLAIVTAVALGVLIILNLDMIKLASAAATAERRPALLNDAKLNKPLTAIKFKARFSDGSNESTLLEWLNANGSWPLQEIVRVHDQ